jgi:hypothetical protein
MASPHLKHKPPEAPLSEEEARATFERFKQITSGLLRVPKSELEAKLSERRADSRRPVK